MLGILVSVYNEVIWSTVKAARNQREVLTNGQREDGLSVLHDHSERSYMQVACSVVNKFRAV